ncbi:MAG: cytochrome c oxidase subunit 3 family protein [Acidobacteriota bacterium]
MHHHFETLEQQKESSFLGMWLFLAQEVMFFGGVFAAYVNYRVMYPDAFIAGSQQLDPFIGAVNTLILLCSSFTMVYAVWAAQNGKGNKRIVWGLIGTLFFGAGFLGVKYVEYGSKFEHNLFPGDSFVSPVSQIEHAEATEIFFSLYFGMTGLHALHMVVGMGIMLWMLFGIWKGYRWAQWNREQHNFIEGFGLYWHFVDIVWIFLYPFLYLIGESVGKLS